MAPLRSGLRATAATQGMLVGLQESLAAKIERYRTDKQRLRDLNELLARVWAVTDILSETTEDVLRTSHGLTPPPVLSGLRALAETLEKCSRIEVRLREADRQLIESRAIRGVFHAAVDVLRRLLPHESMREAILELGRSADARFPLEKLGAQWLQDGEPAPGMP